MASASGSRTDNKPKSSEKGSAVSWVYIAPITQLSGSARHHITLRHEGSGAYHSLLLFCFPAVRPAGEPQAHAPEQGSEAQEVGLHTVRFYCMEATCPHLGAPLENATLELAETEAEVEDVEDWVAVCPWHEYDFSLSSGESSTGMKACVYAVQTRGDRVWIEAPVVEGGTDKGVSENEHLGVSEGWKVIEVRAVSEAFANVNRREKASQSLHSAAQALLSISSPADDEETPSSATSTTSDAVSASAMPPSEVSSPNPEPKTLIEWACLILRTAEPTLKVAFTRFAARAFRTGKCKAGIGGGRWTHTGAGEGSQVEEVERKWTIPEAEQPPDMPPRLADMQVRRPGQEGKRGKGGSEKSRIALLHSLANIEQWAIDLAWDIIARAPQLAAKLYGDDGGEKMPIQFFADFVKIAEDEAKHYSLLAQRLVEMGSYFGALPVHHGLWESARETAHSLVSRLCIIHLVHEARGLDVNPTTIRKFANAGDTASVDVLTIIHLDEVTHVSAGHRWLTYLCARAKPAPRDPVQVFREEVRANFVGKLKGPFNATDRERAGLEKSWYEDLAGEKQGARALVGVQRAEVAGG